MRTLPAQGAAQIVSVIAMAGCAMSLFVHALVLLGFYTAAIFRLQLPLFLGGFAMLIVACLAQEALLSQFTFAQRMRGRSVMRALTANAPTWLRYASYAILAYALALFLVFSCGTFLNKPVTESDELRIFTAYTAAFYAGAAMILMSYSRTDHPLRPDELQ